MIIKPISLPTSTSISRKEDISNSLNESFRKVSSLFSVLNLKIQGLTKRARERRSESSYSNNEKKRFNFISKKLIKVFIIIVIVLIVLFTGSKVINSISSRINNASENPTEISGALAKQNINKEFTFPLKDDTGEEVGKIKYEVQTAEFRKEILVKGQKASAVEGRIFLIINLKITNEHKQSVSINTKDFVRLSVNGNEDEWLAPDIHNDPVEVQAISTKYTRLGFAINDSDKDLLLRVGEINGDKETIPLNLK